MILFFSDLHLGIRSYSQQSNSGLFTAELEAQKALEEIYTRASQSDISMIIFGGDWFHTNQPTTENIRYTISWIKKIDKLGKPFYIIVGNHDASMHSSSLAFLKSLILHNTKLISDESYSISWKGWDVIFVPYQYSLSMKQKDEACYTEVSTLVSRIQKPTLIVSHFHESSAKIGSESLMIAKGVDFFDIESFSTTSPIIFLLGHIHKFQVYQKKHMTICYSGNTFFHDASDCNTEKGYCLVNDKGEITFHPLTSIRKFILIHITDDNIEHIRKLRTLKEESVIFVTKLGSRDIDFENSLRQLFLSKNSVLGGIKYLDVADSNPSTSFQSSIQSPYVLFQEYVKTLEVSDEDKRGIIELGSNYIERNFKGIL